MNHVLEAIKNHKAAFEAHPYFEFLQDPSVPPRGRLAHVPSMAFFIMFFADLNRYLLPVEPTTDPYQKLINLHAQEDDHHWPWYLDDLVKLGFDGPQNFTATLRFLWGKETNKTRIRGYSLAAYVLEAEPIVKLTALEALEAIGEIHFRHLTSVANQLREETGVEYRFFGSHHLRVEPGQIVGKDQMSFKLEEVELNAETRQQCLAVVDKVFKVSADGMGDYLAFALRRHSGSDKPLE